VFSEQVALSLVESRLLLCADDISQPAQDLSARNAANIASLAEREREREREREGDNFNRDSPTVRQ